MTGTSFAEQGPAGIGDGSERGVSHIADLPGVDQMLEGSGRGRLELSAENPSPAPLPTTTRSKKLHKAGDSATAAPHIPARPALRPLGHRVMNMSPRSVAKVCKLVEADKQAEAVCAVATAVGEELDVEEHDVVKAGQDELVVRVKGPFWNDWDAWRAATTRQLANLHALQESGVATYLQLRHESFKEFWFPYRQYLWDLLTEDEKTLNGVRVKISKVLSCFRSRKIRTKYHLRTSALAFASTAAFYVSFPLQRHTRSHPTPTSNDFSSLFSFLLPSKPVTFGNLLPTIAPHQFRPKRGAPRVPFSSPSSANPGSTSIGGTPPMSSGGGPYPGVPEYKEEMRQVYEYFKKAWKREEWSVTEDSPEAEKKLRQFS
ncbi:hypothetical protein NBRC10513v2_003114 [Rhodotorula toruloides]